MLLAINMNLSAIKWGAAWQRPAQKARPLPACMRSAGACRSQQRQAGSKPPGAAGWG